MMIRHGGGYNVLFATPWVAHIQHVFGHARDDAGGAGWQGQAVADAFAVKVNIGLGVDGDAVDGLGGHG